jgi:MFS family permease
MSPLEDRSPTSSDASDVRPQPLDAGLANQSHPGLDQSPSSPGRTWMLVLAAGLFAGLAGFGIGEVAPRFFPVSRELPPEIRRSSVQMTIELGRRSDVSHDQSAALAYGGLGMILGLTLGVAGGLARRSPGAAIVAGVVGMVLGGAAGAGMTRVLLPFYHATRAALSEADRNSDLALALETHGGIWLAVGAAAGLALGIGLGGGARTARAFLGGLMGAGVGAAIYEFGGAIVFPLAETFRPMAKQMPPRLSAHLAVALCVAAGALFIANHLTLRRATPRSDR